MRPPTYTPGLRVLFAGPLNHRARRLPNPYGGPSIALDITTPAEGRKAVDDLVGRGAAVIKIALETGTGWPMLSVAEVRAIVDEAHLRHRIVTAHAMRAGVAIQMGGELLYGTDDGNRGIPDGIDVQELQLMKAAGLTPTQVLAAATS